MRLPHTERRDARSASEAGGPEAGPPSNSALERAGGLKPVSDFALALERRGNETVVVLAGELDLYRAPEIEGALAQATEPEVDRDRWGGTCGTLPIDDGRRRDEGAPRCLTVDLRRVTFLDSTTLMVLLAASRRQRVVGGELVVLVGPQTPTTAFEVTGFDRLLAIRRVDTDPTDGTA